MNGHDSVTTLTEAVILAALRDCYDPATSLNVVELGLIEAISIEPDWEAPGAGIAGVPARHRITIAIILTGPNEDSHLPAIIQNRLAAFEAISRTEVEVQSYPLWTAERVSPEGRIRLAAHLNSRKPADALVQIDAQIKT